MVALGEKGHPLPYPYIESITVTSTFYFFKLGALEEDRKVLGAGHQT